MTQRPALLAAALAALVSSAHTFSVQVGSASQCGDLDVNWSGGTGPFQILITPLYNVPVNISVPSSADGSYTVSNLRIAQGKQFVVTMSDSTGFNSGGTSPLITVGPGNSNCNTTATGDLGFSFQLPNSLQQCNPYQFVGYSGAAQPVTITGLIPGGEAVILKPPVGPTMYQWPNVNVAAGTSVIFSVTDAKGGSGGSSDAVQVQQSNDQSCLNGNSPTSTAVGQPSSTSGGSGQSGSSNSSVAAIAGAVVGCLVGLAAIVSLALFFIKRRKATRSPYGAGTRTHRIDSVDLDHDASTSGPVPAIYPYPYHSDSASHLGAATDYRDHSPTSNASAASADPFNPPPPSPQQSSARRTSDGYGAYVDATSASGRSSHGPRSSASRKAAMANSGGSRQAARYILHTDMDDIAEPDEHGVVELPPQYTERRQPSGSTGAQSESATGIHSERPGDSSYPPNSSDNTSERQSQYP
ncbi:hypothetical protein CONPUDRAFT_79019 [Coniophora puteana RWD-64-598 SS2]|uniref:Mid2 domain-containing protein n=1 Tax=Coniophora puteana (strain RWD-64-598) TaxID=741705 RepID=A0A5M3N655_CONPW|nr:uncharacterized protein CONPUDRAFT_79019 [Coniophora puteana RWD-64-598 SS2]EIW86786.1 hypothetical protein CONPUDRAFT_79019 [Coniophora puteana RWD-64-598 SS2]